METPPETIYLNIGDPPTKISKFGGRYLVFFDCKCGIRKKKEVKIEIRQMSLMTHHQCNRCHLNIKLLFEENIGISVKEV